MKYIILFIGMFCTTVVSSQKMITRSGEVKFEASVPAFEEIAASTTNASCILDKATGDIAVLVLVKAFRFKIPLMEEHFNENYIESDHYPKATFKGKILNYDVTKLTSGRATFYVEGDLTLHGVTKPIKTKMIFTTNTNQLVITSDFTVKTSDFKIKIPSLVKSKIAEVVTITLRFNLENK